jgi:hypothetical protein
LYPVFRLVNWVLALKNLEFKNAQGF